VSFDAGVTKSPGFLTGVLRSLVHSDGLPEYSTPGVGKRLFRWLNFARRYGLSYRQTRNASALFQDVETYCLLVGNTRSGGSTLSALLDAHPNVILADEVDTLQYLSAGFTRDQIYYLLCSISQKQAIRGRKDRGKFTYQVPGQWQGRFTKLRVIGDSKAGKSTRRLAQHPNLLQQLRNLMQVQTKLIHVLRNPFDSIAEMNLRSGRPLANGVDYYFENCATVASIRKQIQPSDFMTLKQEELLDDSGTRLSAVCHFLGLEASEDYLSACISILYKPAEKARSKVQWNPELIATVTRKLEPFDFLQGYSYQD